MKSNAPVSTASGSIDHRIDAIEARIALRRTAASAHRDELHAAMRNKLTSPLALVLAAATGFAIGQLARPRDKLADNATPASSAGVPLLSTALSLVNLIGSVSTILARLKPQARRANEPQDRPR